MLNYKEFDKLVRPLVIKNVSAYEASDLYIDKTMHDRYTNYRNNYVAYANLISRMEGKCVILNIAHLTISQKITEVADIKINGLLRKAANAIRSKIDVYADLIDEVKLVLLDITGRTDDNATLESTYHYIENDGSAVFTKLYGDIADDIGWLNKAIDDAIAICDK